MTPREAKAILDSNGVVSVEEIAEAQAILQKQEDKNKKTNPENSRRAYREWQRRNKEMTELRNEIRKYWSKKSS